MARLTEAFYSCLIIIASSFLKWCKWLATHCFPPFLPPFPHSTSTHGPYWRTFHHHSRADSSTRMHRISICHGDMVSEWWPSSPKHSCWERATYWNAPGRGWWGVSVLSRRCGRHVQPGRDGVTNYSYKWRTSTWSHHQPHSQTGEEPGNEASHREMFAG